MSLSLDPFARRLFDEGGPFEGVCPQAFLDQVVNTKNTTLVDGYASFCKHIFVPNFTAVPPTSILITDEIQKFIQTDYLARRENELPVLTRWVPKSKVGDLAPAKYLDLILYTHEQLKLEAAAMGEEFGDQLWPTGVEANSSNSYAIISIKPQDHDFELPMQPITMLRNCIISEGGSGVPLDRQKYHKSVEFWRANVEVKFLD